MNGDGRLDLVVANKLLSQGTVSVLLNTTSGPGSISFANPISYPVTGSEPIAIDLADTNQDGMLDIAIGYVGSEFVSVRVGKQQGILQTATDRTWATWLYRATLSRAVTSAERNAIESSLTAGYLVFLKTPDGGIVAASVGHSDRLVESDIHVDLRPRQHARWELRALHRVKLQRHEPDGLHRSERIVHRHRQPDEPAALAFGSR